MLYLNPPFFQIEGVTVARDYSDPTQYWYYPNRPMIALDEQGRPAIRLLIYKAVLADLDSADDEAAAGFLFFDTVLSWDEERLKRVARQIQRDQNLHDEPRLSPLLYRAGKTKVTFLDAASAKPGDPPPAPDAPVSDWVTFIEASGTPSLYGENRAIFNVALSAKGARFVLRSFEGFIPAGVIYELDYVAMQRAYQVTVNVDWNIVYHLIDEHEKNRVFFWSSDIQNVTEKLFEDKVIEIRTSIEGVGDEGMEGEAAEAKKQLTKFIFDTFFEQKVNPKAAIEGDTASDLMGLLEGVRDAGMPVQLGYTRRTLDTEQLRTFDADMTAYRAVERKVAPQAHLSVFWEDLNVTRDQVITIVDDDDAMFRQVPLKVLSVAPYGDEDIAHIVVDIVYGDLDGDEPAPDASTFSLMLNAQSTSGEKRDWFDPAKGLVFHYRYTVAFGAKAQVGADVLLTSPWKRVLGDQVTINPAELYEERTSLFQRSTLLKTDTFPEVIVEVRYVDPVTGWTFDRSQVLDEATKTWTAAFRVAKGSPAPTLYRAQFLSAEGTLETDWLPAKDGINLLNDPRENVVTVNLIFPGSGELDQAIVKLEHSDPAHDIHEDETIVVPKAGFTDAHAWTFRRAPGAPPRYRFSYVLLRSDGEVVTADWAEAETLTLVIGGKDARKWQIRPELVGPPLSANGVERVEMAIAYDDDANDYHAATTIVFTAPGPGTAMTLELKDLSRRDYTYTATYVMQNGFRRKIGPIGASTGFPVLSSAPPA